MMIIQLSDVESIILASDTSSSNAGDWIVVRTIQGQSFKTKGIISFTPTTLYGDLALIRG